MEWIRSSGGSSKSRRLFYISKVLLVLPYISKASSFAPNSVRVSSASLVFFMAVVLASLCMRSLLMLNQPCGDSSFLVFHVALVVLVQV
ncbi:hypothetical protein L2E82_20744 [Cichorium intybus]|uniref:Uncharacterized protein n=1 Tax=Cichorium intybus TaxID=13427 RepID=A0ACB9DTW0_CICIN|nr:hypothetical protein L2E82_20744 [Cichorium intybus]